jgi:ABC-type branched-subunit amino acid transport system substrate-binding protein
MRKHLATVTLALTVTLPAWSQDIVIGQSVALSGANADIGRDMRDGALAVFNRVNTANVLGRRLKLITLDNANSRERALENTQQLLGKHVAMVLFGYNSATSSIDSIPLAARSNVLFFAPFSGSLALRNQPNVFTIRASYREEALKIIEAKRAMGADKAVIVHYDDEVGRSNYESVAAAYAETGATRPPGVAVKRGATLDPVAVDAVLKSGAHYALVTTQYGVVSDLLKAAGDKGTPVSIAALSFVNPDELAESVGSLARGTMVSQVIPSPRVSNQVAVPLVKECADDLNALNGAKLNYTSLESCIAANALVAALKKAGPKLTRESVLQGMASLGRLDLGGYPVQFGPDKHQGSSWVELTMLSRGNRFVQ